MTREPVFVTRKFPPSVGGMETLAAGVQRALLNVRPRTVTVAMGRGNRHLLWWVPWSTVRLLALVLRGRVAYVLTGDALMYAVVSRALRPFGTPVATMVMGLDVTYQNPVYQRLVGPPLRRAPLVLAISAATAAQTEALGVPRERISVVRLGVRAPAVSDLERSQAADQLRDRLGLARTDRVLLTLGRLVRRKGVRWFCEQVMPRLDGSVHYLVAGTGADEHAIAAAAREAGVAPRVRLLGNVDDELRELLLRGTDLFVQPNIPVVGDMEGFGLVTVEAAMRGRLVVAADLEGIKDAVQDGETGVLLPPADTDAWTERMRSLLSDPAGISDRAAAYGALARERFSEAAMGADLTARLDPLVRRRADGGRRSSSSDRGPG